MNNQIYFEFLYNNQKDEWTHDSAMLEMSKILLNHFNELDTLRILDIGCGSDLKYFNFFHNHKFLGIDIIQQSCFPIGSFIKGSFLQTKFSNKFEIIMDNGCFHHQDRDELPLYFKKIKFLLSTNGIFSCCVWKGPFVRNDIDDKRNNHYFESKAEMENFIKGSGLQVLTGEKFLNESGVEMFHFVINSIL